MLEILKKAGVASGVATIIVLLITAVPIYYQYTYTVKQNAKIAALEERLIELEAQKP